MPGTTRKGATDESFRQRGTNDLVVTTQDAPKVGDVVTAKGTLHKDKDFGAGYKYRMIVEEATVKP